MVTLGSDPGVSITSTSGTVGGISVGRAQYLILVGVGNAEASATTNEPIDINSRSGARNQFGDGSDLYQAYKQARQNGANTNYIKALMAETTEQTESFATSSTGTLSNAPVVGGAGNVSVTDTGDSTDMTPVPVFDDPPEAPSDESLFHFNPNTGEWATASSGDYDVTYETADWASVIDALSQTIQDGEFGLVHPLTSATSVAEQIAPEVEEMRKNIKMVNLAMPVQPNATTSDGYATIDSNALTNNLDDDSVFLFGPTSEKETASSDPLFGQALAPAVAGTMAGNDVDDPVYGDELEQVGALGDQMVSRADVTNMRAEYVIPIRDVGTPKIKDNRSTYNQEENGGWERDFFTRRVADLVIAMADRLGERILGDITDEDAIGDLEEQLVVELDDLVDLDLLVPGGQFVETYEIDQNTVGVDMGITPQGVAKSVDVDLTIAV